MKLSITTIYEIGDKNYLAKTPVDIQSIAEAKGVLDQHDEKCGSIERQIIKYIEAFDAEIEQEAGRLTQSND